MVGLTIVVGVVREIFWGLPIYDPAHIAGAVPVHQGNGLVMGATILVLLRAFANGGSSLTGVEAISNTVDVFRKPQGLNARRVLTAMASILGFLLAGVAYLAHVTHATPYRRRISVGAVAGRPGGLRQRGDRQHPATSSSRRRPPPSCSPVPTPASTVFRRWPVSSPKTASCRGS